MNAMKSIAVNAIYITALTIFTAGIAMQAQAQQLYRIVGADGKVTFSDQPPPATSSAKVTAGRGGRFGEGNAANTGLPSELQAVANKFPVTLFTAKDCAPCTTGRVMLQARGIPFTEKTIESSQDSDALKRLMGEASLPSVTIGAQQIQGFSDFEWGQYLDLAGYPKTSQLTPTYRPPAASPLVARVEVPAASAPAPRAAAPAPAPAAAPAPSNPAGIKF